MIYRDSKISIPPSPIVKFQYSILNSQIREVQQAKYLGVTLNNKLTWSDHIQIITKKAIHHMALYDSISILAQPTSRVHSI